VKTVRFAKLIQQAGVPEAHLLLIKPEKDRDLQKAIKAQRVMTVFQEAVGTKADRGEIGFREGKGRQFLVFPKSLRRFTGSAVVGIKYELLAEMAGALQVRIPRRSEPRHPAKSAAKQKPKGVRRPASSIPKATLKAVKTPRPLAPRPKPAHVETPKIVPFAAVRPKESSELAEAKREIRKAIAALEDGKQVVALRILQRISED
jgi:hypothetical protein